MNPYYTHREFLTAELEKLKVGKSRILEFGVGDGSSLIFSQFAKDNPEMQIDAYESDENWLNETQKKYSLDNYRFHFVEDWMEFLKPKNFKYKYDLVFVDQAPWEARTKSLDVILSKSKTVILHDYDFFNHGIIKDIYSVSEGSFFEKYEQKFEMVGDRKLLPPTLIFYKK